MEFLVDPELKGLYGLVGFPNSEYLLKSSSLD